MATNKRAVKTLVQTIREELDEMREQGRKYCIAMWSEADADAGYLIDVGGRMFGVGEYQHGFSHIYDLVSTDMDENMQSTARAEAAAVVGNIAPLNEDDRMMLQETIGYQFGAASDMVCRALASGSMYLDEAIDLGFSRPSRIPMECAGAPSHEITMLRPIEAGILAPNVNGRLDWETRCVAVENATMKGRVFNAGDAWVEVPGVGSIRLEPGEYEASPLPTSRPSCKTP